LLLLEKLKQVGVSPKAEAVVRQDGPLAGKTVVITGTLSSWSRKEAENLVEILGGRAASSVSKKTSFVVAGKESGSKLEKARALNIEVLDEQAFQQLIEEFETQ
jgi:DNA ligase (NAD+)